MTTTYLEATAEMKALATKLFRYTGKKYKVSTANYYQPQGFWDGGSKDTCILINRDNLAIAGTDSYVANPWDLNNHKSVEIPKNHFVIKHTWFCGKDMGITFLVRSDEMDTGLLQQSSIELSKAEKIVLIATSYKSSYAGIKDYRFHEANQATGISKADYLVAKESLIVKKLLNKAGAITVEGKNAKESLPRDFQRLALAGH